MLSKRFDHNTFNRMSYAFLFNSVILLSFGKQVFIHYCHQIIMSRRHLRKRKFNIPIDSGDSAGKKLKLILLELIDSIVMIICHELNFDSEFINMPLKLMYYVFVLNFRNCLRTLHLPLDHHPQAMNKMTKNPTKIRRKRRIVAGCVARRLA